MNFFKFSKFSKLLSACVSFGILFSGFQTSGMENPGRLNLDRLGIGIRDNSGGDDESAATKSTVASPLEGIEVKSPECCKFCDQKVSRLVRSNLSSSFICNNNDCLQKCYNEFLDSIGLKSRKLDTDSVHRCDYFKSNMRKLEEFKKAKYEVQQVSQEYCKQACDQWEKYDKDKFADVIFMACGHSVCDCIMCNSNRRQFCYQICQTGKTFGWVCPKCKAEFSFSKAMALSPICKLKFNTNVYNKFYQLIKKKLDNEWHDRVIYLSGKKNIDIVYGLVEHFRKCINLSDFELDENKFWEVDDMMSLGENILVIDGRACFSQRSNYLEISKLDGYIKYLIKYDRYKDIVYPVEGELHDKIKEIKFIEDNAIIISKELHNICSDKAAGEVYNKMLEDNVE